jgi:hypothetical protein
MLRDMKRTTRKNPHAAALGRLGGKKGGKRRMELLSPAQRSALGQRAARARWRKEGGKP